LILILGLARAADDVPSSNPKMARSQVIGGIIWGTGQALLEQSETDPASGQFINRNYSGYLVPTNADIPELLRSRSEPAGCQGTWRVVGRHGCASDYKRCLSCDGNESARSADHN
jgi:hypothetical protein